MYSRRHGVESILISASIKSGHYQDVRDIVAEGPPFELPISGIERHCVFLHRDSISFLFEGPVGLREVVRSMVNRALLSQMMRINAHIEGIPRELETAFRWSAHDEPTIDDAAHHTT